MANFSNEDDGEPSSNGVLDAAVARSLSSAISPDDWRLYQIMRELRGEERARVLAFAEMLYNMQRAKKWAKSGE